MADPRSIFVIEEVEEVLMEETEVVIEETEEQEEEEEEEEEERPRRSTRSVVTKSAADASSRRRRSVEPVRYAQLQEEDVAMAKAKAAQQQLNHLRKGEKRVRPPSGGGGGNGGRSSSSSKRTRAEERRSARQQRRRDALSPTLSSMAEDEESAWHALPPLALDGSGPRSLQFTRPADAALATAVHSTAWRRTQLGHGVPPPANLLPLATLTPFAAALDRPLESYDAEVAAACHVLGATACHAHPGDQTEHQLKATVAALLADATPRVERCHATRVAHVLSATRESVRACLSQLPAARRAGVARCRKHVVGREPHCSPLERVVANRQRENLPPVDQHDEDESASQLPTYFVGKGDHSVRERAVLPKEPALRLPKLPCLSRSTTCIGVRGTLPVDDDPIIRTVPVFTKPDASETPATAADVFHAQTLSTLDDDRRELVLRFVVSATQGDPRVFDAFRALAWAAQPQTDYRALQLREAKARVAKALASEETKRRHWPPQTLTQRLRGAVGDETVLAARHCRQGEGSDDDDDARLLAGFRALFCRRCYVYNCQFHGIHQPRATARIDPVHPTVKTSLRHVFEPEETEWEIDHNEVAAAEPAEEKRPEDDEEQKDVETTEVVRRSVRSVTAAATKATTLLVTQKNSINSTKQRKRSASYGGSNGTSKRSGEDASEYFGYGELYRKITTQKRTAMRMPQRRKLLTNGAMDGDNDVVGCSPQCYRTSGLEEDRVDDKWTPRERLLLQAAERTVVGASRSACVLAHLLGTKRCTQVHHQLGRIQAARAAHDELQAAQAELQALRGGPATGHGQVASVRGNTPEHLLRTRFQRMKDRGSNHQYVPCHHAPGTSCNANDCACMRRDHFCDKACACPPDCANKFPGCRCVPGACGTTACPCYFAGRECDPDACRACGACEVPLLALADDANGGRAAQHTSKRVRVCANTSILRGAHRRVGVAESTTHGWGAFAREAIGDGEFIYEYTGELLSQDEAERRGNVYDRNAVSFLFDLNEDAVVDAARKGNKSKFANHSSTDPNCAARIVLVQGDHRIGLYAKRAIAAGEELFFDYGHHGVVPDWSQSRIRSSGVKGLPPPGAPSSVEDDDSTPSSPRRVVVETEGSTDDEQGEEEEMEMEMEDHPAPTTTAPVEAPENASEDDVLMVDDE